MNGRSLNPGDQSRARVLALNKRAHTTPPLVAIRDPRRPRLVPLSRCLIGAARQEMKAQINPLCVLHFSVQIPNRRV